MLRKVHKGTIVREYTKRTGKVRIQRKGANAVDFTGYRYSNDTFTKRIDGSEDCVVELEIDYELLFDFMARRAAATKGGKAILQGGLIAAKVLSRKQNGESTTDVPIADGYEIVGA